MGWNQGYTIYEETVIAAYNTGYLTPEMLKALLAPYRDTDIDHGGCRELRANDGLTANEIVVKLLAPEYWKEYSEGERDYEAFFAAWNDITGTR